MMGIDQILTEEMQLFDYWSGVYSPADQHIDSLRAAYDAFQQHYTLPRTEEMQVEDFNLALSSHCINMRVFQHVACQEQSQQAWIFYIHGGGNVVGSADSHEYIARQLARDLKAKVFLPEYGLVPEFDWQQGLQDCIEVYQQLQQQAEQWKIQPKQVVIAADGSAVATALQMQQMLMADQQPQALALLFPSFMPQNLQANVQPSLIYQLENQQLMQEWTGICAEHAKRDVPKIDQAVPNSFVALTEYDLCAQANAALLTQLRSQTQHLEVETGQGLRGNCLPLLRDCAATAQVYEALLKFLHPYLKELKI